MDELSLRVMCPFCKLPLGNTPKVLPGCLHVFCLSCLQKLPISFAFQSSTKKEEKEPALLRENPVLSGRGRAASVSNLSATNSQSSTLMRSISAQEAPETSRGQEDSLVCSVSCPKCSRSSLLPLSRLDSLPTDFLAINLADSYRSITELLSKIPQSCCELCTENSPVVSYCMDCKRMICGDHAKCHHLWEEFSGHRVFLLSSILQEGQAMKFDPGAVRHLSPSLQLGDLTCLKHSNEKSDHLIKFFCSSCSELVCGVCISSNHKDGDDHLCISITSELLSGKKKLTEKSFAKLSDLFKDLDVMSEDIQNRHRSIVESGDAAKKSVEQVFSEVIQALEARKDALCSEIDEIVENPLNSLIKFTDKVETMREHLRDCRNFVRGHLDSDGDLSLLTVADAVAVHTGDLELECKGLLSSVVEVSLPEIIVSKNKKDLSLDCIAQFSGVHLLPDVNLACQEKKSQLRLEVPTSTKGSSGNSSKSSFKFISDIFSRNLHDSITSHYIYAPSLTSPAGSGDLYSPELIEKPRMCGIYIRSIGGLTKPSGIRIDRRNSNMVVCIFGPHQVRIMDQFGTEIHSLAEDGNKQGQFLFPQSSVRDSEGRILVVDSLCRIQVFDKSYKFLKTVGQKGKGQIQFNDPVAIVIATNKKIYICERQNNRIQILNSNFTFGGFIGKTGRGECEFHLPSDLTASELGHLYVVDAGNHRIQVLSLEGSFLCSFGGKGSGPGELSHPSHVCVGSTEICVTEEGNHRVSIFSLKGYFIQYFGQRGSGEGEFNRPLGIAVDQNKTLYVCDSKNDRIQIFK